MELQAIHAAASEFVCATAQKRPAVLPDPTIAHLGHRTVEGAFVSLKRREQLRGCTGFVGRRMTLKDAIRHAAVQTTRDDVRMPPVSAAELEFLQLETWLLSGPEPIQAVGEARMEAVEIGKHGLKIIAEDRAGLLLPGVAVERKFSPRAFLEATCNKARLPKTAWKDPKTQLFRFSGTSWKAPIGNAVSIDPEPADPWITNQDLQSLVQFCDATIRKQLAGLTTDFYLPSAPDGMVNAIALGVPETVRRGGQLLKVSLRPGMPLQSTLHAMSVALAGEIAKGHLDMNAIGQAFSLTIGYDVTMNGTLGSADLRGVHPPDRSLLLVDGNRQNWVRGRHDDASRLLAAAAADMKVTSKLARLYSLKTQSTTHTKFARKEIASDATTRVRDAAVAGRFYPADPAAVGAALDRLFPTPPSGSTQTARYAAAMVPHAGWRFSGSLAAMTLARIQIPTTVLILSPKHTRNGQDWAVAPYESWKFPSGELRSDKNLASKLVDSIPELVFDAAAHRDEHGIEVELPMLHRLAPDSQIVGVAIGGQVSFDQCQTFASRLANVLGQSTDVLLLISSDMNHFADDRTTRHRDAMAIDAITSLAPRELFERCIREKISMCGRVPAVIAMEALRQMGMLTRAEMVGYATSGDVTGDLSRVVGYCSMLFQ